MNIEAMHYRFEFKEDRLNFNRWLSAKPPSKLIKYGASKNPTCAVDIYFEKVVNGRRAAILRSVDCHQYRNWRGYIASVIWNIRREFKYYENSQRSVNNNTL